MFEIVNAPTNPSNNVNVALSEGHLEWSTVLISGPEEVVVVGVRLIELTAAEWFGAGASTLH